MISLKTPHPKWASSRLEGEPPGFYGIAADASRVTTGTSGTRSGGFIKGQSPCQMLGSSLDNSPVDARAEQLVWIRGRNLRFPLQC